MKPTKESLIGVLAEFEEHEKLEITSWQNDQLSKVKKFAAELQNLTGIETDLVPDSSKAPITRIALTIHKNLFGISAVDVARKLREGIQPIWLNDQNSSNGQLTLEIVALNEIELKIILQKLDNLHDKH